MEGPELPDVNESGSVESQPNDLISPSTNNFWLYTSLIVMVLSIIWFFYTTNKKVKSEDKPIPIVSTPAQVKDVPVVFSALGTVIPTYNVTVRAQVAGILQQVFFKEGQLVQQGTVLALIDPRPYEAQLKQYEGNLKRDTALLANARIDLKRYKKLWQQDSISQQTLATQQALVDQYEGTVKSDEALIDSTQINLGFCRIKSPIDGRIGLRLVDAGNFIQLADTNGLAVINTVNPITVIFSLPEDYIPALLKQMNVEKELKVYAYDRQQNELLAEGHLLTMDNQIDPSTGTVKLKAEFINNESKLFPNQFVNIKILVKVLKKAIIVPTAAIQHTLASEYVYVLDKKRVRMQEVSVGPTLDNEIVVTTGLSVGQLVVIEGADKLVNGAVVSNNQESTPTNTIKTALTEYFKKLDFS